MMFYDRSGTHFKKLLLPVQTPGPSYESLVHLHLSKTKDRSSTAGQAQYVSASYSMLFAYSSIVVNTNF